MEVGGESQLEGWRQEGQTGWVQSWLPGCVPGGSLNLPPGREWAWSMRVARGSASWLSSHGRGLGPAALRIRCTPYPAFQGRSMQGAFTERSGEKSVWKTDETCVSSSGSGSPPGVTSSRTLEKKCQESCPPPCPRGAGHTPAWTHVVAEVLSFPAQ